MARSDFWIWQGVEINIDPLWVLAAPTVQCTAAEELSTPSYAVVDTAVVAELVGLPDYPSYRDYLLLDLDPNYPPDFALPESVGVIRAPILMLEYVKTTPEITDGLERHRDHLLMIMSSAIAFYAFLKIDLPVFGFLIECTRVIVYAGWVAEPSSDANVETACHRPLGMGYKAILELDVYRNPLDALHRRQMMANILEHSKKLEACQKASEVKVKEELKERTFCRWKQRSAMQVIGEAFPAPIRPLTGS